MADVSPYDLVRVEAIKKFMADNPNEAHSVLNAVIFYLERGDEDAARYKIELDSDKFSYRKEVLHFLDTLDLIREEYKARLVRWDLW